MNEILSQGSSICLELPFVSEQETGQIRIQIQKRKALGEEFKQTQRISNSDLAHGFLSVSSPLWLLHQSVENGNEQL